MIDLRLLRTDPDAVRAALARRGQPEVLRQLDQVIALDATFRELVGQRDAIRAEINEISKQVGAHRRAGDVDGATALQQRGRDLGDEARVVAVQSDGL